MRNKLGDTGLKIRSAPRRRYKHAHLADHPHGARAAVAQACGKLAGVRNSIFEPPLKLARECAGVAAVEHGRVPAALPDEPRGALADARERGGDAAALDIDNKHGLSFRLFAPKEHACSIAQKKNPEKNLRGVG